MPNKYDYESVREANIARNRQLLIELNLDLDLAELAPPKPIIKRTQPSAKKRKERPPIETVEDNAAKHAKMEENQDGPRRSARNSGKKVDYKSESIQQSRHIRPASVQAGLRSLEMAEKMGREDGMRIHDPKTFGAIPGIEIGTWWEGRKGCSVDAVHAPLVAGISGNKDDGAYSVALSGGYDDDVDLGYAFTYTGSGGRDLKGTKQNPKNLRTAPQSCDQTFDNPFNAALQRSAQTMRPVRVVRGFKGNPTWSPVEGYRYDGLYVVEKAWIEPGLNPKGYKVCKFAFKRLPDQPPICQRETTQLDSDKEDDDILSSTEQTSQDE